MYFVRMFVPPVSVVILQSTHTSMYIVGHPFVRHFPLQSILYTCMAAVDWVDMQLDRICT